MKNFEEKPSFIEGLNMYSFEYDGYLVVVGIDTLKTDILGYFLTRTELIGTDLGVRFDNPYFKFYMVSPELFNELPGNKHFFANMASNAIRSRAKKLASE